MKCQKCNSERVAEISGKCSDCCSYSLGKNEMYGNYYVPVDMGVGGGDYIQFSWCLNCGQLQGKFPLPQTEIEKEITDFDLKEFYAANLNEGWNIESSPAMARRRMIQAATKISNKFGAWLDEFFIDNINRYPSRLIPSEEKFIWMYKEGITDLTYQ